jgi:hypothetical protein
MKKKGSTHNSKSPSVKIDRKKLDRAIRRGRFTCIVEVCQALDSDGGHPPCATCVTCITCCDVCSTLQS